MGERGDGCPESEEGVVCVAGKARMREGVGASREALLTKKMKRRREGRKKKELKYCRSEKLKRKMRDKSFTSVSIRAAA